MHSLAVRYTLYRRRWSPIVPLTLTSSQRSIQAEGYLDSGAFDSVFRLELLIQLGLQPRQGKTRYLVVGDGSFIPVHIFKLSVEMLGERFVAEMAFSDRWGWVLTSLVEKASLTILMKSFFVNDDVKLNFGVEHRSPAHA